MGKKNFGPEQCKQFMDCWHALGYAPLAQFRCAGAETFMVLGQEEEKEEEEEEGVEEDEEEES